MDENLIGEFEAAIMVAEEARQNYDAAYRVIQICAYQEIAKRDQEILELKARLKEGG